MEFLERRRLIREFFNSKKERVYCQTCGYELTHIGALINEEGEAYCHDVVQCLEEASLPRDISSFASDFFRPKEMQELIQEGRLTHFAALDK
ncbi:Uncharacterised protein [uncultured archaeon]|nr:Uncharacterised protein [uncultured archaeon]